MYHHLTRILSRVCFSVSLTLILISPGFAENFTITETEDQNICNNQYPCSLRTAILLANNLPGPDTILLSSGKTYTLSIAGPYEDEGLTGDLDITESLEIKTTGNQPAIIEVIQPVDENNQDRIFHLFNTTLDPISLYLNNLVIIGGAAPNFGGALLLGLEDQNNPVNIPLQKDGSVILHQCKFENNSAKYWGGAIFIHDLLPENTTDLESLLLISETEMLHNTSQSGGAIFYVGGNLNIFNSTFKANTLSPNAIGTGGAIYSLVRSNLFLANSLFLENYSINSGGAMSLGNDIINQNAQFQIENTQFVNNQAEINGGALMINSSNESISINQVEMLGNSAKSGGALHYYGNDLEINDSLFSVNHATGNGGALFLEGNSVIHNSTVNHNTAGFKGGGIHWVSYNNISNDNFEINYSEVNHNIAANGGGIYVYPQSPNSEFILDSTTVAYNTAHDTLGGGGIYLFGKLNHLDGAATFINSTISQNYSAWFGGGIFSQIDSLYIFNSSMVSNQAHESGGAIYGITDLFWTEQNLEPLEGIFLHNNLFANNKIYTLDGYIESAYGGHSNIFSLGGNLETGNTFLFNPNQNLVNITDAKLGPLSDNGGLTQTHKLLSNSPAIDNGYNNSNIAVDQRGVSRNNCGTRLDIGAYEYCD